MNPHAYDPFREMDALAGYLFDRMARNNDTDIPEGYRSHQVLWHGDLFHEPEEEPDSLSPRVWHRNPFLKCTR